MLVVSSYSQEDVESADKSAGNDIYWDYDQESLLADAWRLLFMRVRITYHKTKTTLLLTIFLSMEADTMLIMPTRILYT